MDRFSRRAVSRTPFRIPVRFGQDNPSLRGFIINMSSSGAAIQTNRVFPPGSDLSLRLDVHETALQARGRVRWARKTPTSLVSRIPSMMGIEFTTLDDAFQEYLRTFGKKK